MCSIFEMEIQISKDIGNRSRTTHFLAVLEAMFVQTNSLPWEPLHRTLCNNRKFYLSTRYTNDSCSLAPPQETLRCKIGEMNKIQKQNIAILSGFCCYLSCLLWRLVIIYEIQRCSSKILTSEQSIIRFSLIAWHIVSRKKNSNKIICPYLANYKLCKKPHI